MALNSQGCSIRRISTVTGTTGSTAGSSFVVNAVARTIACNDAGADFAAAGFAAGMRLTISGATNNNTGIYTISSVAATVMGVYEVVTAQAAGDNLTITANKYDSIGGIKGFNGPSGAANVIDITDLDSTAKKKLIGLRDEGQVTLDVFLQTVTNATVNDPQVALKDDRANRTLRQFDIMFNDSSVSTGAVGARHSPSGMNFDAYVSGLAITGSVDNAMTASITLEITSAVKYISKI